MYYMTRPGKVARIRRIEKNRDHRRRKFIRLAYIIAAAISGHIKGASHG